MDPDDRSARNARDRTTPFAVPEAVRRAWSQRAEQLEGAGMGLIEAAQKRPTSKSRANGEVISAQISAGLRLLEAADKLWLRIGRIGGAAAAGARRKDNDGPPSLGDYRRRRPPVG